MKLFYKKDYEVVKKLNKKLIKEKADNEIILQNRENDNQKLETENEKLTSKNKELQDLLLQYEIENKELKNKLKICNGKLGNKTREINKLTKKLEKVEKEK